MSHIIIKKVDFYFCFIFQVFLFVKGAFQLTVPAITSRMVLIHIFALAFSIWNIYYAVLIRKELITKKRTKFLLRTCYLISFYAYTYAHYEYNLWQKDLLLQDIIGFYLFQYKQKMVNICSVYTCIFIAISVFDQKWTKLKLKVEIKS